jgi:hypothetical protein
MEVGLGYDQTSVRWFTGLPRLGCATQVQTLGHAIHGGHSALRDNKYLALNKVVLQGTVPWLGVVCCSGQQCCVHSFKLLLSLARAGQACSVNTVVWC